MGICYDVACRTCKVVRDIDKSGMLWLEARNRDDAKKLPEQIQDFQYGDQFRLGLLLSFLADHMGHDIVIASDTGAFESVEDEINPDCGDGGYREDGEWWRD